MNTQLDHVTETKINVLYAYADIAKERLEQELLEMEDKVIAVRKKFKHAPTLVSKLACLKLVKAVESERSNLRRSLYKLQDEIEDDVEFEVEKLLKA